MLPLADYADVTVSFDHSRGRLFGRYSYLNSKDSAMPQKPIEVGQAAPDFELAASVGDSPLRLSSLRERYVVLGFYVLDFTST